MSTPMRKDNEYHVYSTTEKVVGEWIDGRKIYEKSVEYTSGISTGNNTYPFDTTGIDIVLSAKCWTLSSGGMSYPMPATPTSSPYAIYFDRLEPLNNAIRFYIGQDRTGDLTVVKIGATLQYVKTP